MLVVQCHSEAYQRLFVRSPTKPTKTKFIVAFLQFTGIGKHLFADFAFLQVIETTAKSWNRLDPDTPASTCDVAKELALRFFAAYNRYVVSDKPFEHGIQW